MFELRKRRSSAEDRAMSQKEIVDENPRQRILRQKPTPARLR